MRYLMIGIFVFSSIVFAQNGASITSSSGWGIYGGAQSMQVSGVEDDATDEELDSFSTDRLSLSLIHISEPTRPY